MAIDKMKVFVKYLGGLILLCFILLLFIGFPQWRKVSINDIARSEANTVYSKIEVGNSRENILQSTENPSFSCDYGDVETLQDFYIFGDPTIDISVVQVNYNHVDGNYIVKQRFITFERRLYGSATFDHESCINYGD